MFAKTRTIKLETTVTLRTNGERLRAHLLGIPGKSDIYAAAVPGSGRLTVVWKGLPLVDVFSVDEAENVWKFLLDGCLHGIVRQDGFPLLDERSQQYLAKRPEVLQGYQEAMRQADAKLAASPASSVVSMEQVTAIMRRPETLAKRRRTPKQLPTLAVGAAA